MMVIIIKNRNKNNNNNNNNNNSNDFTLPFISSRFSFSRAALFISDGGFDTASAAALGASLTSKIEEITREKKP